MTYKKKDKNKNRSLKKIKDTIKNKNKDTTIDSRLKFIDKVITGKLKISSKEIHYPLSINHNPKSTPVLKDKIQPCDIFNWFQQNGNIQFLSSDKGSYGYPYQLCYQDCLNDNIIALKIILLEKDSSEIETSNFEKEKTLPSIFNFLRFSNNNEDINQQKLEIFFKNNSNFSQNAELRMIYLLSNFVKNKETPHINLPILGFRCNLDTLFKETRLHSPSLKKNVNMSNILLSEWCRNGSLRSFLDKQDSKFKKKILSVILFQIIYTLFVIQVKYPNFRHNDLRLDNILVQKSNSELPSLYQIIDNHKKYNFVIPNYGFQLRLWDFDFSCIKGLINNLKVLDYNGQYGISENRNQYYDLFTFCYLLKKEYQKHDLMNEKYNRFFSYIFKDIDFNNLFAVNRKLTRILINEEVITPKEIIEDSIYKQNLFSQFLKTDNNSQNYFEIYKTNISSPTSRDF